LRIYYNTNYNAAEYAFDTTRKSRWIADRIFADDRFETIDPQFHVEDAQDIIDAIHDEEYVTAIKTGAPKKVAESQGFTWDEGIYTSAVAHTAGIFGAIDSAMVDMADHGVGVAGTLSSGLHHAKRDHGDGFCTFNGLAAGVVKANLDFSRHVTVLDLDAHAGGGTVSFLPYEDDGRTPFGATHLDVTVSPFDTYRFGGTLNLVIPHADDVQYLKAVDYALGLVPEGSLVIYNAGMDPFPQISRNALRERERMVAEALVGKGCPTAFTLAGGYTWSQTPDELVDLHMETLSAFAEVTSPVVQS